MKKTNSEMLLTKELKKIIKDWSDGQIYRECYNRGLRGEELWGSIIVSVSYKAEEIKEDTRENPEKYDIDHDHCFNVLPRSDVRSTVWEVLSVLEGYGFASIENITHEDIPAILEFLDACEDTVMQAWEKWEYYWENLDYKARRKRLLEYDPLKPLDYFDKERLERTKTKITVATFKTYRPESIQSHCDIVELIKKEFTSKEMIHQISETLDSDTKQEICVFIDDSFISFTTQGKLGSADKEVEFQDLLDRFRDCYANNQTDDYPKNFLKYNYYKSFYFCKDILNQKTLYPEVAGTHYYFGSSYRLKKTHELFDIINKEFHGRKIIEEKIEDIDEKAYKVVYEFEDGSCIQLIVERKPIIFLFLVIFFSYFSRILFKLIYNL